MSQRDWWEDKLAQYFHDPFWKAFCQGATAKELARSLGNDIGLRKDKEAKDIFDTRAQDTVAMLLSQRVLGDTMVHAAKWRLQKRAQELRELLAWDEPPGTTQAALEPDWAHSGADRPVLGTGRHVHVLLWQQGQKTVEVTHPLAAHRLSIPVPDSLNGLKEKLRPSLDLLDSYRAFLDGQPPQERAQLACLLAWRRLPEDLAALDGIFWPLQPADTRCPDHSIWEHLRLTAALAFLPLTRTPDHRVRGQNEDRRPWLFSLWVGPAREFLGHARTGRDLWTGSMILSELAWAAMEAVSDELGPDNIIYPDLRANPRADLWLRRRFRKPLRGQALTGSRASLIPNRFVALVPESEVERLAEAASRAVSQRWQEMATMVREHLASENRIGPGPWQAIFDRQVATPPLVRWAAVAWHWDGMPKKEHLKEPLRFEDLPPTLPFQKDPPCLPDWLVPFEENRKSRFHGLVSEEVYAHYQAARWTFLQTFSRYLFIQRGFDYALTHWALLRALEARKLLGDRQPDLDEPGDKCTLCGVRQALTNVPEGTIGHQRANARKLWQKVDPDGLGAERLCGPCAVRRFLFDVQPERGTTGSSQELPYWIWEPTVSDAERGGKHPVPFPATSLVAGQSWLENLARVYSSNPRDESDGRAQKEIREAVQAFLRHFRRGRIRPTQFAGSLAGLRRLLAKGLPEPLRELFKVDLQYLDPSIWDRLERTGIVEETPAEIRRALETLRKHLGAPPTHLALILLDGDRMGELLLGTPERIRVPWKAVLHSEAVRQIRNPISDEVPAWKRAWRSTLESSRLMGPNIHVVVSRALRDFSTRILPWVVEREYHGRLIYAGGDDALILCPAGEALPLLDRLQELFSAAWVLDRYPEANAWRKDEPTMDPRYEVGSRDAKSRFRIVKDKELPAEERGLLLRMLGPNSHFSAGVSFGHYKTPMRLLRSKAEALQKQAKALGGNRLGACWFTRSGPKVEAIVEFSRPAALGQSKHNEKGGAQILMQIARAFRDGSLPMRLPYKLRELAPLARALWEQERGAQKHRDPEGDNHEHDDEKDSLEHGRAALEAFVRMALEHETPRAWDIAALWDASLRSLSNRNADVAGNPAGKPGQGDEQADGLDFLFLARALSAQLDDSSQRSEEP